MSASSTTSAPSLRLENFRTGEILELRRRRRGSDTWLELRGSLRPRREGPPMHVHHAEDEHGEVVAGTLSAEVGGKQVEVGAGGTVTLPMGIPHRWWNAGDEAAGVDGHGPADRRSRSLSAGHLPLSAGHLRGPERRTARPAAISHSRLVNESSIVSHQSALDAPVGYSTSEPTGSSSSPFSSVAAGGSTVAELDDDFLRRGRMS